MNNAGGLTRFGNVLYWFCNAWMTFWWIVLVFYLISPGPTNPEDWWPTIFTMLAVLAWVLGRTCHYLFNGDATLWGHAVLNFIGSAGGNLYQRYTWDQWVWRIAIVAAIVISARYIGHSL